MIRLPLDSDRVARRHHHRALVFHEPHDGVDDRHGRGLAAREHEIAERDLLDLAGLDRTVIPLFQGSFDGRYHRLRNLRVPLEDGVMPWPPDGAKPANAEGG